MLNEKTKAKSKHFTVYRIAFDAMLIAIYVIFAVVLVVKTPTAEYSWISLPIFLCAFLFGPVDTITVAVIGSFIEQLVFGLNAQAIFWMLPVIITAVVASVPAYFLMKKPKIWKMIVIIVYSEIILTVSNLAVLLGFGYLALDLSNPFFILWYAFTSTPKLAIRMVMSLIGVPPLVKALGAVLRKTAKKA